MKSETRISPYPIFVSVILCLIFTSQIKAQSLIINHHSVAAFDSIPDEYKSAAADIRMLFMDRSVGFNISSFLDCMSEPWAEAPSFCKRYEHMDSTYEIDPSEVHWDGTWDRSNWRYAFWPDGCSEDVTCFIDYMDDRLDSFDVMGCQFSYLAVLPGSKIADTMTGFFGTQGSDNKASTYLSYAADHPDKKIIWWTTSLARGIGTTESESFNAQMREYALEHDIILFDVADILSHDPSGLPCFDNRDGVTYKDESHPDDGLDIPAICPQYTTETEGGHLGSISAGGVRVAKAFWVLMARIAGWEGETTSANPLGQPGIQVFPNPTSKLVMLQLGDGFEDVSGEINIYDLQGKILLNTSFSTLNNGGLVEIPLYDFSSGLYFISARWGSHWCIEKLVVK